MGIKLSDISITVDNEVGAKYIYLQPKLKEVRGCVVKTLAISNEIYVDLDENDDIIGIEIL